MYLEPPVELTQPAPVHAKHLGSPRPSWLTSAFTPSLMWCCTKRQMLPGAQVRDCKYPGAKLVRDWQQTEHGVPHAAPHLMKLHSSSSSTSSPSPSPPEAAETSLALSVLALAL